MNEQMIGNAQHLVERLGASEKALRRRIAELEEENRKLKTGEYRAEQIARAIDAEVRNLDNDDFPNAVAAHRLLALPADSLLQHEGLSAWYAAFKERTGLDPERCPAIWPGL